MTQLAKLASSLLLLLICCLSHNSQAQLAQLGGKVVSKKEALAYVSVILSGTKYGANTDVNGNFTISDVPEGNYLLITNALGYKRISQKITLKAGEKQKLTLQAEADEQFLNEVVVSGTMREMSKLESPVPVEVYSAKFFQANPAPSVFESLQNVNGVRPQLNCNICNTGDIHINGLEGPYTMILIDGMPIVSGLSTVYGLTGIPQSLIERIEIVKGPASSLYGSEAVGGLINIITKKPSNAPLFSAESFSSNWRDINTDLGIKLKAGKKANALLGLNYFNYQQPYDNNRDGFTDITLQNRISLFNKWSFDRKSEKQFSLAARYVYEDRWGGDIRWNNAFRGGDSLYAESIYTNRWEVLGSYQLPVKEDITLQISTNRHQQNSFYGTTAYHAQQVIAFGQLLWNKQLSTQNNALVGMSYRYTYYDDNTPATAQLDDKGILVSKASRISLPGIFIQNETALNPQNKVLLAMRYDYNSLHGNVFTPRLNYKLNSVNKRNIIRFSLGNGYRVANVFTEDHAALTGARTVVFAEKLRPETSWNANINFVKKVFTQNATNIVFDASAFYTHFGNRIIPDYTTDVNKIIYANLGGSAVSKGLSLSIDAEFSNNLKVKTGMSLIDVRYTNEQGLSQRQLLTEPWSGVWSINYTFAKSNISIDYTGNVYGPMVLPLLGELDDRAAESPVWSLQNIQVTKVFKNKLEFFGGVKNLLNYTPPANSIARAFDPFDKQVQFDSDGKVVASANNPKALSFDPSYVFAPNQGIRVFLGFRYKIQ